MQYEPDGSAATVEVDSVRFHEATRLCFKNGVLMLLATE